MIRFEGVRKSFGPVEVLRGIDAVVESGQVIVVCGASGSGKSTLLRTINRLEEIDGGRIHVAGKDIHGRDVKLAALRSNIGFVFQQFNLFPHLTALENITIGLRRVRHLSAADARTKAERLLDRIGLGDKADHYPAELSGGQQQRVAIMRALSMDPPVMLFDEPTSALDPELVEEVLTLIKSLAAEGMTMVCVTHEMAFAQDIADVVWFMADGKIVETAPPSEFFVAPKHPRARRFLARLGLKGDVSAGEEEAVGA